MKGRRRVGTPAPLAVALAMAVALVIVGQPPSAQAEVALRTQSLSVVLLGDSYSAGNGAGDYVFNDGSYRSGRNWASTYVRALQQLGVHASLINRAHSGWKTADILVEAQTVPPNTDLVMFTAGGNDGEFPTLVKECYALFFRGAVECRERVNFARNHFDEIVTGTNRILDALARRLGPSAEVVLLGYPLLATDRSLVLRQCYEDGMPCDEYDVAQEVRKLGVDANQMQANLVNTWNAGHRLKVTFVPDQGVFGGHEPDPSAASKNDYRWVNEFLETEGERAADGTTTARASGDLNEFYHPNLIGHQEIASLLMDKVGVPSSATDVTGYTGDIDISFVVADDGGGAVGVDVLRGYVDGIIDAVSAHAASARFSVVGYNDRIFVCRAPAGLPSDPDPENPSVLHSDFSSDAATVKGIVDTAAFEGGCSMRGTVYDGLMKAIDLDWRPAVRKVAIVVGPPPVEPVDPSTGNNAVTVAQAAYEKDPVEVSGVDPGWPTNPQTSDFTDLVSRSGGTIYRPDEVPDIAAAVTSVLDKPFGWLQGPYVGKVGSTLTLDAGGSYAVQGTLDSYEWDFDGDGDFEQTTTTPSVEHTFTELISGVVGVRVTDSHGLAGLATTPLAITDDGDQVERGKDNCPDVANQAQTDEDTDGVGDECDSTPGYPTTDRPGVTEVVVAPPPAPALVATGRPTISGKAKVGKSLKARLPRGPAAITWSQPGVSLSYEWVANGIVRSHKLTYKLRPADSGLAVRFRVQATKAGFTTGYATSNVKTLPRLVSRTKAGIGKLKAGVPGFATVTVKAKGLAATGTVSVLRSGIVIASMSLPTGARGKVRIPLPALSRGRYTLRFNYSGSEQVKPSSVKVRERVR